MMRTKRYIPIIPVLVTALALVSCTREQAPDDYLQCQASLGGFIMPETRGTPVTSVGGSFSAWAYSYVSGGIGRPNYLCGETFTQVRSSNSYRSANKRANLSSNY